MKGFRSLEEAALAPSYRSRKNPHRGFFVRGAGIEPATFRMSCGRSTN